LTTRSTPVAGSGLEHVEGAQRVGLEALVRVLFQQRQVLERSGVEHHLGPVGLEHLEHALGVAHRGDDQRPIVQQPVAVQGELKLLKRRVVDVEHHQLGRG
jgi:hypothetical protein